MNKAESGLMEILFKRKFAYWGGGGRVSGKRMLLYRLVIQQHTANPDAKSLRVRFSLEISLEFMV
jgi:hypothetical protein